MGRKNKIKSSKKASKDVPPSTNNSNTNSINPTPDASASDDLSFLDEKLRRKLIPDTSNSKPIFPAKPNMTLDGPSMQRKLSSLPTKNRSATAERLIRAHEMIDEIETLQASRQDDFGGENDVDINILKDDPSYIRECVLWIKAFISSDFRVVNVTSNVLFGSPLPSCWMHITSLYPLDENMPQLMHLDAISFVVLLATAIRLSNRERYSLQIVHELHAHADGNYECLDFDLLEEHDETKDSLDESYLRFSLAWVGIKRSRALYRDPDKRISSPFQSKDDVAIQSRSLLKSVETLAQEQIQYMPKSPVGKWNMGWCTSQVKYNGRNPWVAAVEYFNLNADCCLLANEADDDFYRANAGIEAAVGLVLGGKPLVGCTTSSGAKVQVLRKVGVSGGGRGDDYEELNLSAPNPTAARDAGANEQRRLQQGVPPTTLERGETVLVAHWEATRLWNYAMEAYTRVESFGYGQYIYGETWGWGIMEAFLRGQYGALIPEKFLSSPQVGFTSTRNKGSYPCDYCGKIESNLKKCSVCKKAQCE